MSDIFISYAREDVQKAGLLASELGSLGWSVFTDRRIPAGTTWADVIGKELDDAKCVVVIWSKASIGSRFVKLEAHNAMEKQKLIPVRMEDVKNKTFEAGLSSSDIRYPISDI